jgi:protein gp37
MGQTTISWADFTLNSWWGCTKISSGCDRCYADTFSHRLGMNLWGKDAERRFFGDQYWRQPLRWNAQAEKQQKRLRVFCGSMCDIMEDREDVKPHRERLYALIQQTPWLDWLLLTKRPQNFRRFLPAAWLQTPQPNVWLMTTVESSDYLWRIDALKSVPAVVRGLSIEPLLEDLPTLGEYLNGIAWVIVGGESGHGARPLHPDWVRRIRHECSLRDIAFHFKQAGNVLAKQWGCQDQSGSDLTQILPEFQIRQAPGEVAYA